MNEIPIDDLQIKEYDGNYDNEAKILCFLMYNLKEVYSVIADYFLYPENKDIYAGIKLTKEKNLELDVQTLVTLIHSNLNPSTQVTYEKVTRIYKGFNEFRNIQFCIQLLKDDYIKSVTTKKLFREVVNIVSNRTMLNIDKLLTTSQSIVNNLTNIKENSDDILMTADVFSKKYLETNDVSKSIVFANKVASVVIQEKGVSVYTE